MSSQTSQTGKLKLPGPPRDIRLRSWPIRDEGPGSWVLASLLAGVAILAGVAAHSWAIGLLSLVALFAATLRLWLPITFTFGPRGLEQQVFRRRCTISWGTWARYEVMQRGVLLLPSREKAPLAVFRGLFIPWGSQREDVLSLVEYYVVPRIAPYDSTVSRPAS